MVIGDRLLLPNAEIKTKPNTADKHCALLSNSKTTRQKMSSFLFHDVLSASHALKFSLKTH